MFQNVFGRKKRPKRLNNFLDVVKEFKNRQTEEQTTDEYVLTWGKVPGGGGVLPLVVGRRRIHVVPRRVAHHKSFAGFVPAILLINRRSQKAAPAFTGAKFTIDPPG